MQYAILPLIAPSIDLLCCDYCVLLCCLLTVFFSITFDGVCPSLIKLIVIVFVIVSHLDILTFSP